MHDKSNVLENKKSESMVLGKGRQGMVKYHNINAFDECMLAEEYMKVNAEVYQKVNQKVDQKLKQEMYQKVRQEM